jgi:integrase
MKGHIRERSAGHFAIILDIRDTATGARKRRWHSFKGTKRQAQIECAKLISDIQGDRYQEPDKTTVAIFLERWLEYMRTRVAPTTFERYAMLVRKNIIPALGAVVLTKLRPDQIAAGLAAARRRDGKGALSLRTVHHLHTVLKGALKQAVRWGALNRNPCDANDAPRVEKRNLPTYDMAATVEMLELARSRRIFIPALLASMCGLRRGEVVALRWRNADLETAQASIVESLEQTNDGTLRFKPPKSKPRTIALPAFVVEELRVWRIRQAQELLQLGIRQCGDTLVCAREDGLPLQPRSLTHSWDQFVKDKALTRIRFHDLRHAHATHLLASGVHPKIASERLGHSKIGITLDLYSHVIPGMQEDAVARVDEAVRQALQKRAAKLIR